VTPVYTDCVRGALRCVCVRLLSRIEQSLLASMRRFETPPYQEVLAVGLVREGSDVQ
jgi:hypothetical protein